MVLQNQAPNPAIGYMNGMLQAAFGIRLVGGSVAEWQIDTVKECAMKLKEAEIDHQPISDSEKTNQKLQWHQWLDACTRGFKDVLRREGRLG